MGQACPAALRRRWRRPGSTDRYMATQAIVIPYCPRDQFTPYHDRKERWAKVVAHRRFGKTVGTLNDMIRAALTATRTQPPPRFAYIAPTYSQAKDVAWQYLKHFSSVIPGLKMSESELWVEYPNGARIRLYGADNYDRMRGLYHDGVTIDEPAQMDPRAWPEVIRPTLSDYQGWATFIGTPSGRDWFFKIDLDESGEPAKDFFRLTLKASDTGIIPPDELQSLKAGLTEEQFAQEFECSFEAAIIGAYYGKLMAQADADKRTTGVPYEPTAQVYTAWDLGIRDSTAIWFAQVIGREIHVIDYYEASGVDLGHYVREISSKPYLYAGHIVPHDAQAKELGTGKSRLEVLESLGLKNITVARMHRVEDGINAVRTIIPRCWFDAKKCARGIDALKLYRSEYDEKLQSLKPRPVHDWASHAADSFRYLAMTLDSQIVNTGFNRPLAYANMGYA
jgi:phage terminase large subunit